VVKEIRVSNRSGQKGNNVAKQRFIYRNRGVMHSIIEVKVVREQKFGAFRVGLETAAWNMWNNGKRKEKGGALDESGRPSLEIALNLRWGPYGSSYRRETKLKQSLNRREKAKSKGKRR